MSVRIKYDVVPDFVKPKLDDFDIPTITLQEYKLKPSLAISTTASPPITKKDDSSDSWYSWTISLTLNGLEPTVKGADKFFKTLDKITATITQVLKIIRLFSANVNSISGFLKFAIKQLAKELKEFVDSLASTGIYSSFIIPDFDKKFPKYTIPTFGGYQEFITRVNATCLGSRDPDAPKFEGEDKVGGVVIAMLGGVGDPDFLRNLLDNFKKLGELFGFKIPYPSPANKLRAIPGFYDKNGIKTLGVKLTWEAPDSPVGSFYVYRSGSNRSIPVQYTVNGIVVNVVIFTNDEPIVKVRYSSLKATYTYIDFDVQQESTNFYKVFSVFGDDYLEDHPYLKAKNSPISTPVISAHVPKECIPLSELKKYMNLSISGELLSPIDLEGDWQSVTVRRMLGNQMDGMFDSIDALADKLTGLVGTGSDAVNDYLKFYGERVASLLEIIDKLKSLTVRLSSFSTRGTFMVLKLPLEKGGMSGFVDRFNKACNSGTASKELPKDKTSLKDFLVPSANIDKNAPISKFNEKGIMFGLILLYGIPDVTNSERLKELVPEGNTESMKKQYERTGKAISTLLKMLGLG